MILQIVRLLRDHGVTQVVVSPGSRHYPLIRSLEASPDFTLYSVVDERSAAFFALGLIQRTGRPAAVTCTSGTSVLNYGPAVAEAFYQSLPLLVLSSDRLPEFLDQLEDQMLKQSTAFDGFVSYAGTLKPVRNELDEWYCNRILNEGMLALQASGPVHINFPIENHSVDTFGTKELPNVRLIHRIGAGMEDAGEWAETRERLRGRRILLFWGQSRPPGPDLLDALGRFTQTSDVVIVADHLSNLHHPDRIWNSYAFLRALGPGDMQVAKPDIVISMYGNSSFINELRSFLKQYGNDFEHWRVAPDGRVVDPFRRLTRVFSVSPEEFFHRLVDDDRELVTSPYRDDLLRISSSISNPADGFDELGIISDAVSRIPHGARLHIANSAPMRMTQLSRLDPSVIVAANRGINGIDGCVSTAVGYAADGELTILIVGDLTFFYDMNALWNRHLSPGLRILLMNNSGGAVMHMPIPADKAASLGRHVSAEHGTSAEGWAESAGCTYAPVRSWDDWCRTRDQLLAPKSEAPVVVEVFTDRFDDVAKLKSHVRSLHRLTFGDRVRGKLRSYLPAR